MVRAVGFISSEVKIALEQNYAGLFFASPINWSAA